MTVTLSPAFTTEPRPVITFLPSLEMLERSDLATPLIFANVFAFSTPLPSVYVNVTSSFLAAASLFVAPISYVPGVMCNSSPRLATLLVVVVPPLLVVYVMRSPSFLMEMLSFASPSLISLVVTLSKPLRFLFNLTVNVSAPLASTAMLSLADSNLVPSEV